MLGASYIVICILVCNHQLYSYISHIISASITLELSVKNSRAAGVILKGDYWGKV